MTVSCDNRLMSRTTLSREFALLSEAFGYELADLRRFSVNAAKSAFLPFDERLVLHRTGEGRASPRQEFRGLSRLTRFTV